MHISKPFVIGLAFLALSSITNARAIGLQTGVESDSNSIAASAACLPGKPCNYFVPASNYSKRAAPKLGRPGKGGLGNDDPDPVGGGSPQAPSQEGPGQGIGQGSQQGVDPAQSPADPPPQDTSPVTAPPPEDAPPAQPPTEQVPPPEQAPETPPSQQPTNSEDDASTDLCTKKRCLNLDDSAADPSPARINRPLDYGTAQGNGNKALNEIDARINGGLPKDTFPDPSIGYTFRREGEVPVDGEAPESPLNTLEHEAIFADPQNPEFNVDPNSQVNDVDYISKTEPAPSDDTASAADQASQNTIVNGAKINTQNGVFISTMRDRSADGNVLGKDGTKDSPSVIASHELSWQLWATQVKADGGDIGNLKTLVAESAQGQGTQDTIKNAAFAIGQDGDMLKTAGSKAVFTPDASNPAMQQAFAAMTGTDNVRPYAQMIAQNHGDLHDKVFTKIVVYSNGLDGQGNIRGPDIAISLAPRPS